MPKIPFLVFVVWYFVRNVTPANSEGNLYIQPVTSCLWEWVRTKTALYILCFVNLKRTSGIKVFKDVASFVFLEITITVSSLQSLTYFDYIIFNIVASGSKSWNMSVDCKQTIIWPFHKVHGFNPVTIKSFTASRALIFLIDLFIQLQ